MFYEGIIQAVNRMSEQDPPIDDGARKKRLFGKKIAVPYSKYSGIVDQSGKTIRNPTELQAVRNMIQYLNNNWWDKSNVYRPEHAHTVFNYKKGIETVG